MFIQPPPEPKFDFAEYQRREAETVWRHHQSTGAGLILPLLQSGASALVVGLALAVLSWAFGWGNWFKWFAVGAAVVLVGSWVILLSNWMGIIATLESVFRVDLNQDGAIGEPPPEPETVRVELQSEDKRHTQILDIPTTAEKMQNLAKGILGGAPLSERAWSGSGALFSQNEWRAVRDALMSRGWARFIDDRYPQQGVELSPAGKAVMRTFANELSPTPDLRRRAERTR